MYQTDLIEQAKLLIQRLEKISVDSVWSRRSSGHRGALLKWVERAEMQNETLDETQLLLLENLISAGFHYLEKAARERFP